MTLHLDGLGVGRRLNWHPGVLDIHALMYQPVERLAEAELPQEVDLEPEFTAAYDQLQIGSCVFNALGALVERLVILSKYRWQFRPSRLFPYYNARTDKQSDTGSSIADGVRALNKFGVCPEIEGDGTTPDWVWPYMDDGVAFKTEPPPQCYKDAVLHRCLQDEVVTLERALVLNALAARQPFAFGFPVHKSFMTQQMAQTGVMHVPQWWDFGDYQVGGHGVAAVGYKLNTLLGDQGVVDWVKVRNSWSPQWGLKGYFWMPLDQVLCKVASDAHVLKQVGYAK